MQNPYFFNELMLMKARAHTRHARKGSGKSYSFLRRKRTGVSSHGAPPLIVPSQMREIGLYGLALVPMEHVRMPQVLIASFNKTRPVREFAGANMSSIIEDVRKDIRLRAEMDSMMSNVWLIVYVLPVIIAGIFVAAVVLSVIAAMSTFPYDPYAYDPLAFGFIAGGMALVALLLVLSFVLSLILTYKLIQRRNTHFKRQAFLLEDLLKAVKAIAAKKGADAETAISSGERTLRDAKAEETEKGAVLWAILSAIIPLASWYVNYFLMKDFYKHERREDGFWEDLGRVLDKLGITISMERRIETIPDRSFVLYLILTIITLGLFGIYWLYVLLKDPNEHFKYHIKVEDQLLGSLESAI